MPIGDFTQNTHTNEIQLASPSDRFLSFFFDFLIFSPLVSLSCAYFLRDIRTELILDSTSEAAVFTAILLVAYCFISFSLLQALFWFRQGATPGQMFLKIKVVPYPSHTLIKLKFSQCLVRALSWNVSLFLLGIPFLEIFGHPFRRAFHDRCSDTIVTTLKLKGASAPLPIEVRLVSSWMTTAFALFAVVIAFSLSQLMQGWRQDISYRQAAHDYREDLFCEDLPDVQDVNERLDLAGALFLAEEVSNSCVEKEVERVLWHTTQAKVSEQSWAYFLKAITTTDAEEKKRYYFQACDQEPGLPSCELARWLQDKKGQMVNNQNSVTARMLQLESLLDKRDFNSSLAVMNRLESVEGLANYLQKKQIQWMWSFQATVEKSFSRSRQPASEKARQVIVQTTETSQEAYKKMKKKFGVE